MFRQAVKSLLNSIATVVILPIWLGYILSSTVVGRERAFPGCSQLVSLAPGYGGQYLRRAFYRLVLPACGRDVCIQFGTVFSHPTARLGDRVYVGLFCVIGDVTLNDDVLLGSNVSIINGGKQHGIERLDVPVREQVGEYPRVIIGRDAWIGDRAIVMTDVGEQAVVGAGSVVISPVADLAIVVGSPARVVGTRARDVPMRDRLAGVSSDKAGPLVGGHAG